MWGVVLQDDLIILPAGIYHRFTTDETNVSVNRTVWEREMAMLTQVRVVHPGHAPVQGRAEVDAPEPE